MTWEIRPATPDERDRFVRSTWRKSFVRCDGERRVWNREQARYTWNPKSDSRMCPPHSSLCLPPFGRAEMLRVRGPTDAKIQARLWLSAHAALVDQLLGFTTAVCVADIAGECLGWVAYQPSQLHYVYVSPRFRRRGVGSDLLRHAVDAVQPFDGHATMSHLTYEGELLLDAVLREKPRNHTRQPAAAEVHDG